MEYYNQVFDQTTPRIDRWTEQEFEQCTFRKLDLSKVELTNSNFVNCRFDDCNLTNVVVKNTKLYDVSFAGCKLAHVDFGTCNPFGFHVTFQECQLDYSVFLNRKLKKAHFTDCSLKEVHFLQCDLTGTSFNHCNLELARFDNNNLTQVDFSTSYNLELNPDENKLKKARFSLHNLPGLLTRYDLVISK
ncbi:pentapeptide repeat-containing protein [Spirosoma sp. KNUC1025]|uniref:pentapeptide repeat-containing protein n=1 Tax=Spirosoma sp. KNUC1025 TaxID=2894082 RepID=UPI003868D474|nr:pentapeptide repeat-containing protein [Spirosoma sp. KNUC1025]